MSLSPIIEQASSKTALLGAQIVTPGEIITTDPSYMRGHGTYLDENNHLRSSIAGLVSKLNRLVLVKPLSTRRYVGDIGDVVIGRVLDIGNKRWRVDIRARQDAILQLSSIPLPGGIQRRKSEEDELMMRNFFAEGQILVAEVQTLFADGALGIHTRNARYGKLLTGELITVQPSLIKRAKSHFGLTEWDVELIIGINGYIWIGKPRKVTSKSTTLMDLDEASLTLYNNDVEPVSLKEREAITRTRNVILMMDKYHCPIDESSIKHTYHYSLHLAPFDILKEENAAYFIEPLSK
jgi:exosome complex component RRP4